ncbi:MAG: metallophosphoesterase [Solirubrobacteraceae bacterium]|nr:metallophosphoesterase [Patulibacter sp.]
MSAAAPRLLAVSDLHVAARDNRRAVAEIPPHPDDWLILAGDVGDTPDQVRWTLDLLAPYFAKLVWVPGNHDLWAPAGTDLSRGEARYEELVEICRSFGVLTPEDPFATFPSADGPLVVAPLFTFYDYSFREALLTKEAALELSERAGIVCMDEYMLPADPYPSREAWCAARVAESRRRLDALPPDARTVLVSHWPLRRDTAQLKRIPQFELWCGTVQTDDWHIRYRAAAVVYGHLHRPGLLMRDGVPFHEVAFGYPQERRHYGITQVGLRDVLSTEPIPMPRRVTRP